MNKSFKLVFAMLLTVAFSQILYCQDVRTVDRQIKVYIYAPSGGEVEKVFVERLAAKLQERGEMKVLKSTKGYDYIVSIIADTVPDFDLTTRSENEIPPPETFIVSTVIISRESKETYKKQNLQASRNLNQIVERVHALLLKVLEKSEAQ